MTRPAWLTAASLFLCGVLTAADPPKPVAFGPLSATPPADWQSEKPKSRLRSHQFRIPSGMEGVAAAEVTVNPQQNPDPARHLPGWKAQFAVPEGQTADDISKVSKLTAGPATVHLLDVSGTWRYKEFPMSKTEEPRPGYRVVWALVVVGDEASAVRLSGPKAVVDKQYPAFEGWLKGMK